MWEQRRFLLDTTRQRTPNSKKSGSLKTPTQSWESSKICLIDKSNLTPSKFQEIWDTKLLTICPVRPYLQFDLLSIPIKRKKSTATCRYLLPFCHNILNSSMLTKWHKCSWRALKITATEDLKIGQMLMELFKNTSRCHQYLKKIR